MDRNLHLKLKKLINKWVKYRSHTGDGKYDEGLDSAHHSCAEELEEVLRKFNKRLY